jgi:hypothetical protein
MAPTASIRNSCGDYCCCDCCWQRCWWLRIANCWGVWLRADDERGDTAGVVVPDLFELSMASIVWNESKIFNA